MKTFAEISQAYPQVVGRLYGCMHSQHDDESIKEGVQLVLAWARDVLEKAKSTDLTVSIYRWDGGLGWSNTDIRGEDVLGVYTVPNYPAKPTKIWGLENQQANH